MHGKAVNWRRRGDNCRTRSNIKKSRNNAEKTFLYAYLLSLNVIPNKKQADCKSAIIEHLAENSIFIRCMLTRWHFAFFITWKKKYRRSLAVSPSTFVLQINERKGGRLPIFLSFRISFTEIFYTFALVKKENIEENKKEDEK